MGMLFDREDRDGRPDLTFYPGLTLSPERATAICVALQSRGVHVDDAPRMVAEWKDAALGIEGAVPRALDVTEAADAVITAASKRNRLCGSCRRLKPWGAVRCPYCAAPRPQVQSLL